MTTLAAARDRLVAALPRSIDFLDRLLAIDTSLPPGRGYPALADCVAAEVEPLGFACRRVVVPEALWRNDAFGFAGERVNLIAERRRGLPPFAVYAHIDTVPPGPGWTVPPFAATRREGRIYGRGTSDMKGAVVATVAAIRAADAAGLQLRCDSVLLCCTDEEGGTYPGVRYLAEQGLVPRHLLCLNGGAAPRIWAGCFGSIDFHIRVLGRSGHSGNVGHALPPVNAIEAALPLLNALAALKRRVEARESMLPAPPGLGHPLRSRLTLAVIRGGEKASQIPASFDLVVNRRYAPEEPFAEVVAELEATVRAATAETGALGVEITQGGHLAPVRDPRGPHWPRWQKALSLGFGYADSDFTCYGASSSSDMGWVQQHGIEEILLGGLARPDNNIHGADEFTTEADLIALATAILAYMSAEFAPDLATG